MGVLPTDGIDTLPLPDTTDAQSAAATGHRTVSGVQRKLLVGKEDGRIRPALQPRDAVTHIAKFNSPEERTLVQNEALSLRLAQEILGEEAVTRFETALVADVDEVALVVERFDRQGGRHLRLEDFAQILCKPRGQDFGGKYASSYEEAASVIERHSVRARIDLERFYRLLVFNLVIGNADAHLKNFSLLERPEGLRLSPAYDLLNTLLYPFSRETALAIDGRHRPIEELDRALVERLGIAIGLPKAAVRTALDALLTGFKDPKALRAGRSSEPDGLKLRYAEIVHANAGRILA